jgi:TolA-binding protein
MVQGRYADAAAAYIGAIRGWPQTPWAPDAMLKLAKALIALNKPADACRTIDELGRRYPGAPPSAKAKARDIRAAAKCGA